MKQISVVLPAYNEEKNINEAIAQISGYLQKKFKDFEIIVVDDGSTDKTSAVVKNLAKKNKHIKLVVHSPNKGYGAALRSGFNAAQGQMIFYTDSDNQYSITELDKLLKYSKDYDIVAGYRLYHKDPLTRIVISNVYNLIIRLLFGLKVKDVDCSFKLYRKRVFDNINLKSNTGLIDAEVLIKAKKAGMTLYQVGVNHYPRLKGQSIYEIGKRNNIFAFVSPTVPLKIFKEIKANWSELAR